MNTSSNVLVSIAVLKAKAGKEQALKEELLKLIEPTRAEPGNLDYVLFEQRDEQGTFYMREAFRDQAALDALKVHMPLLRNRLVMLLSSQDFEALKTPVGKEMLRQQATASVQELAQKEIGKLAIEQVLFTNFVLQ